MSRSSRRHAVVGAGAGPVRRLRAAARPSRAAACRPRRSPGRACSGDSGDVDERHRLQPVHVARERAAQRHELRPVEARELARRRAAARRAPPARCRRAQLLAREQQHLLDLGQRELVARRREVAIQRFERRLLRLRFGEPRLEQRELRLRFAQIAGQRGFASPSPARRRLAVVSRCATSVRSALASPARRPSAARRRPTATAARNATTTQRRAISACAAARRRPAAPDVARGRALRRVGIGHGVEDAGGSPILAAGRAAPPADAARDGALSTAPTRDGLRRAARPPSEPDPVNGLTLLVADRARRRHRRRLARRRHARRAREATLPMRRCRSPCRAPSRRRGSPQRRDAAVAAPAPPAPDRTISLPSGPGSSAATRARIAALAPCARRPRRGNAASSRHSPTIGASCCATLADARARNRALPAARRRHREQRAAAAARRARRARRPQADRRRRPGARAHAAPARHRHYRQIARWSERDIDEFDAQAAPSFPAASAATRG